MINATRGGIAVFGVAVLCGPLYTVDSYSVVSNLISELGAQHTPNNFIMVAAFIVLGGGIFFDGMRRLRPDVLPLMLFGLAMTVVGIFPHKPLDSSLSFNVLYHNLHGITASVAGTLITIGFIWQGIRTNGIQRIICFYLAGVALIFPLLMLRFPDYQGLIQRIMYLQILGWMWIYYPLILDGQPLHVAFSSSTRSPDH
jgi:hypothetical membrane protein